MKKMLFLVIIGLAFSCLTSTSCNDSSNISTPTATGSPSLMIITVASDATLPPFESINEQTNQIEGMDIDIFNAIAIRENLQVNYKNVVWDILLTGMTQRSYDAAISSITITEDLKNTMLFSDPYFAAGQLIVVRADNIAITGKDNLKGKVGVQIGTKGESEVKKITSTTVVLYESIGNAFQDLMDGQVDAVVCENPFALLWVGKNPDKFKTAGDVFTDESYGIAVSEGKTELLSRINNGLKAIKKEGIIDSLTKKWLK